MTISRTRALAAGAAAVAGLAVPTAAAAAPGEPAPAKAAHEPAGAGRALDILLTNDDGFSAPGLAAVRKALTEAGHNVTVVAPATDQSGRGTGMSLHFGDRITARQESPGVWSVGGTPADSVFFGFQVVFKDDRPDLVVSGTNMGHNTGAIANHSGTVGGAVAGLEHGIPAIAVSTEIDVEAGREATVKAFPATADYLADLIANLSRDARRGAILPPGVALNVNYPITDGGPRGSRWTGLGATAFVKPEYRKAGPDSYVIAPAFPAERETVRRADTTALAADYVSVTPLDGDWTHRRAHQVARSLPRR